MSTRGPNNPDQSAPSGQGPADLDAPMNGESNGPRDQAPDLRNPQTAYDALLRWDELDEQLLRLLAEDPERGKRLRKLQNAEGWLRARAAEAAEKAAGPTLLLCPPSEELYDFGQGPGASGLSAERHAAIDRHLATCLDCERFVATLTTPPPSPLILGLGDEPIATPIERVPPQLVEPVRVDRPLVRRRRMWPAVAAAAAVVVLYVGVHQFAVEPLRFPEAPLLRGAAGGPVLFPRGDVLMASAEVRALFPALGMPLVFEVEAQDGAEEYTFELWRHEGGAFGRDERIDYMHPKTPTTTSSTARAVGHFTFKGFATVHGLPQTLGAHGFEVAAHPDLDARLLALGKRPESERTLAAVVLLHDAGFTTDARALARTLPASPERDRYLAQIPGR